MTSEITAYVQAQVTSAVRRAVTPAAFGLVAGLFVLFAVAGLFAALFFWFEPEHGPIAASLICTAVALVLGLIAAAPLLLGRRAAPPAPQESSLPQFVSLMARSAPGLRPRQLVMTAALLGVALVVSARGGARR
jgi:cytochrome c biogenesis protein CcdA